MKDSMNYSGFSDILKNFRRGDEVPSHHPHTTPTGVDSAPLKSSTCPPYLEVGLTTNNRRSKS